MCRACCFRDRAANPELICSAEQQSLKCATEKADRPLIRLVCLVVCFQKAFVLEKGEDHCSSGTIRIKDYNLGEMKKRKIPYFRRNMGIVFQDFRLIPNMTVYDNVAFAMRVVGAKEKEIRKRVPYVIKIVGLPQKAKCYPNELSGGEQQRVALARALVNNADIIIADEPTGNVDPQMSLEIVGLLKRLNEVLDFFWQGHKDLNCC